MNQVTENAALSMDAIVSNQEEHNFIRIAA
jgi:hypothetical protein